MPWPLVNGGKIRTYNLLARAASQAEIHLRVIREPGMADDAVDALSAICASVTFFDRARPGPWARWMQPKLERWFHSTSLFATLRSELAGGGFQLVHLDELLLARLVPPNRKLPVIQHHHKLDTVLYDSLWSAAGPTRHFDLWKLRRLEKESARRYRHHLLCSAEDADILRERYGALDCGVVPSGYDPVAFSPTEPPPARDPDRIVFVGSMNYGPNVDGVVRFVHEVLPAIRARRPNVRFDIVGGEPVRAILDLASDHITVTGRVPDVRPFLERASLMVVPLAIGGGTRLKIVEALALSTPVVSTTIGAEGLGLVDGEHLVLADGASPFADAVARQLAAPGAAAQLGARGRTFVEGRYRWDLLAGDLVEYWEHVAFSGSLSPSR